MKSNIKILFSIILIISTISSFSQVNDDKVALSDFVEQHQNFVENEAGEIDPINLKELNKIVKFLVEEKFTNLEHTRNIIWDSYETYVSPFSRWHKHTFIVHDKNNLKEFKLHIKSKMYNISIINFIFFSFNFHFTSFFYFIF